MTSLRDRRIAYARQLVGVGQHDKAISLYGVMVAEDASDFEALIALGALHVRAARHDKAASAYERAGEQLHRDGRHQQALAVLREVQRLMVERPELASRFRHVDARIAEIERAAPRRSPLEKARLAAQRHLDRGCRDAVATQAALDELRTLVQSEYDHAAILVLVRAYDLLGQPLSANDVLFDAMRAAWQVGDTKVANELAGLLHGRPVPAAPCLDGADDELSGDDIEIVEELPALGSPTSWVRELEPSAALVELGAEQRKRA